MVNIALLEGHNMILNFDLRGDISAFRVKNTLNGRYFKFKIIPKQLLNKYKATFSRTRKRVF